jgi:F0F1-type ATP synthase delta subunit
VLYDVVGSSYANALVDVASRQNCLEGVHSDIDALASVMKESSDIKNFLSNPTVDEGKKKELVKRIASESSFNQ